MEDSVHVLLLLIECHIPHSQSLKQKRAVIKSLVDRLRSRFNASVSETGFLDEWQRSVVAISLVSNNRRYLQQQIESVEQLLTTSSFDLSVSKIEQHWL